MLPSVAVPPCKLSVLAELRDKAPSVMVDKVKLAEVVLILEAPRPVTESAPDVAVRFKAPVARVRPLEAVSRPADVMVPDPVVDMLPTVDKLPDASILVRSEALAASTRNIGTDCPAAAWTLS